jgi:serine/threonine protein kinase
VCAAKEPGSENESLFMRELVMLANLRHPLVLGLVGYYAADDTGDTPVRRTILTEWMSRGSLEALIYSPQYSKISATIRVKIVVGILLGLRYIHACGVIHRDVKPQNVLLTKDYEPKIGDLGSARLTDIESSKTQTTFTWLYLAPEMGEPKYGPEVDVFSFGLMLWEIVKGETVFGDLLKALNNNGMSLHTKVVEGERPSLDGIAPAAAELMGHCWEKVPSNRPTFAQIVEQLGAMKYQLLPGVDGDVIEKYVAGIVAFEKAHPAVNLKDDYD